MFALKVARPEAEPSRAAPRDEPSTNGAARSWLVRTIAGRTVSFKELASLQKWIVEGRISRDDEISRTGENWKRLGNIAELEPFFVVYENARAARRLEETPKRSAPSPAATAERAQPGGRPGSASNGSLAENGHGPQGRTARGPERAQSPLGLAGPGGAPPFSASTPLASSIVPTEGALSDPSPAVRRAAPPRAPTAPPAFGEALVPHDPLVPPERRRSASRVFEPSGPPHGFVEDPSSASLPPAAFPNALSTGPSFTGEFAYSDLPRASRSSSRRLGIGLVLAGLFVGSAVLASVWFRGPSRLWLAGSADRIEQLSMEAAREADVDTEEGRSRALALLERAQSIAPDSGVIAGQRAFVLAQSAMALHRAAERLDDRAAAIDAGLEGWRRAVLTARRQRKPLPPRPEAPEPGRFRIQAREKRGAAQEVLAESRRLTELAQTQAPRHPEPDRARASHLLAEGNLEALEVQLRRLREAQEDAGETDPYTSLLDAEARLLKATPDAKKEATVLLREVLAARPTAHRARVLLARLALDEGDLEEARAMLAPVLAQAPGHPEAQAIQARLLGAQQKKTPQPRRRPSSEALRKSAPLHPKTEAAPLAQTQAPRARSFREWLALGDRHRHAGRIDAAISAYNHAGKAKAQAPEPLAGKGWCFLDLGRPRLALLAFERATKVRPEFAEAHFGVGEASLRIEAHAQAVAAYRRYLQHAPEGAPDRVIAARKIERLEAAATATSTAASGR